MNIRHHTVALAAAFSAPLIATAADPAPTPEHGFTGNITLASEYLYRGIAQTRGNPALQGGFDYAHSSGLYAGIWGSNISWISDAVAGASASLEIDVYGGYKGAITDDFGFDVGVLTYNYPGSGKPSGAAKPDTTEIYGALSWKWLTLKYSQTIGSLFGWTKPDGSKTKGSGYLELNAAYDLGEGWSMAGHVGQQKVNGFGDASYTDYKLGVSKDLGFGTLGLAYSTTNAKADCAKAEPYCFVKSDGSTYDAGKGGLLVTFGKTF
ncbi:TorF family putative porin [Sulfuricystis multivorans]|uniref:TorF family putative porin n=1 Tax=Sulfuricystis multivorans TaxID=2211108 RepID=UPI000F84984B|nr:TorF family putative porin [Sulfuricystis multivorans]